ncbi:MAG: dienelactone hydrolase family protein [Pseudomonadota bacterium]
MQKKNVSQPSTPLICDPLCAETEPPAPAGEAFRELSRVDRRALVKAATLAPFAHILASPTLAAARASTLEEVSLTLPGGRVVKAALAMPEVTPAPGIVAIHEWWGLNDQIKAATAEYANRGYVALAVDLYDGEVATDASEARKLTQAVDAALANETLTGWANWLTAQSFTTEKRGSVGWCFGGGWSLNLGVAAPMDATVVYYGRVSKEAEELKSLKGPVLGHFATRDRFINEDMVGGFVSEMEKAKRQVTAHWYEADHGFANPTSARYDQTDAETAWKRTIGFFDAYLK